jgi:hypothetical protein
MVMSPVVGWLLAVGGEDLLGDAHRGHGLGPAAVEGQMGDHLDEFALGEAILLGVVEVEDDRSVLPPAIRAASPPSAFHPYLAGPCCNREETLPLT